MLAEDADRLERIDRLYALRLDRYVALPTLVVCGDQSSGKSSVLEGLTGLQFPRKASLCTRFPTQVIFKRAEVRQVLCSIRPIDLRPDDVVRHFSILPDMSIAEFNDAHIEHVLDHAYNNMGFRTVSAEGSDLPSESKFSRDLLKIEFTGPEHEHFSVIDLPGLFRNPIPGFTSVADIAMVQEMVETYLRNERSIILAVMPANVDVATQEIMSKARSADAKGLRTLTVLTKPDIVDRGAERSVIKTLTDNTHDSQLGSIVVCNRNQENTNISHSERNDKEAKFFASTIWQQVPANRRGIHALKRRLQNLLVGSARQHFQLVARDILHAREETEAQLNALGTIRSTSLEQRIYLIQVATSFQVLAAQAVDAYYSRQPCFSKDEALRLATQIRTSQDRFAVVMRTKGGVRDRRNASVKYSTTHMGKQMDEPDSSSDDSSSSNHLANRTESEQEIVIDGRAWGENADINSIVPHIPPLVDRPSESLQAWVRREYRKAKGFELSSVNPSFLPALFRDETRNWRPLVMSHMEEILYIIDAFIARLLDHVSKDHDVSARLRQSLRSRVLAAYQRALDHVDLLLKIEEFGHLRTLDHYFSITLKKKRLDRAQRRLSSAPAYSEVQTSDSLVRLSDVVNLHMSNEDHEVEDIIDILQSYYKGARKQLVDAVTKGGVDYLLLVIEEGPLGVCSPVFIASLSNEELKHLAQDSAAKVLKHSQLTDELRVLDEALKIVKG